MSIGAGITLIVVGLIFLTDVIQVDIPGLNEYSLGVILALAGALTLILSLWVSRRSGVVTEAVQAPATERVVERQVVERDLEDPNGI